MSVRLNLGCGPIQPSDWVNVDNSNRAKLSCHLFWLDQLLVKLKVLSPTEYNRQTRTFNLSKRFPFEDGSVDTIYSGELLEHLTREEGEVFLAECFRVLKPGQTLRIRVPDQYHFWKNYTHDFESIYKLGREKWEEGHSRWTQMHFDNICVQRPGLSSMGHFHKWMYDEMTLILAFERAGFGEVERKALHDSRIEDVERVENREDLIVEGIKPD